MIEENKAKHLANMAALKNVMEEMPYFIELTKLNAQAMRIKYDAFINEGFTPEQALFLCK